MGRRKVKERQERGRHGWRGEAMADRRMKDSGRKEGRKEEKKENPKVNT